MYYIYVLDLHEYVLSELFALYECVVLYTMIGNVTDDSCTNVPTTKGTVALRDHSHFRNLPHYQAILSRLYHHWANSGVSGLCYQVILSAILAGRSSLLADLTS